MLGNGRRLGGADQRVGNHIRKLKQSLRSDVADKGRESRKGVEGVK